MKIYRIQCIAPPGSGLNAIVDVEVARQSSSTLGSFDYDGPVIDTNTFSVPTIGGYITIFGSNFGERPRATLMLQSSFDFIPELAEFSSNYLSLCILIKFHVANNAVDNTRH